MKLLAWLKREDVSFAEMGRRIGNSGEAVRRYAMDLRIPDRETMPKIVRETDGAVTANDFFDIEPPRSDGRSDSCEAAGPSSRNSGALTPQAVQP